MRSHRVFLAVTLLAVACGGSSARPGEAPDSGSPGSHPGSGSGSGPGGGSAEGGPGSPAGCSSSLSSGFSAVPVSFTVPAARCQASFQEAAADGPITYDTLALTGGGHPDLVVYRDQCDPTVGQTHWDIYGWGASGFAVSPSPFTVPAPRCQTRFESAAQDSAVSYATSDLTGDGNADLVVFKDSCDATVGQSHWDVYAWGATGFAAAPSAFFVPAPRCQTRFDQEAQDGAVSYATMDVTGDGHADLVVFKDSCDPTVGQTHWDVYAWGASGFAATPTPFTVPAPRCQTSFDGAAQDGSVSYATMDLTGDGHVDLVVFQDSCDPTVGHTHWDTYGWSASGFAPAPTAFAVPAPRCQTDFNEAAQDGAVSYSTIDVTGDGHPDLVVVQDSCDMTVGQTHWDVYPWSSSGFAPAPATFGLPAPRCQTSFDAVAQDGSVSYAAMRLADACSTNLVVFQDSCDTTVGATHWEVYEQAR